jgi:hypothetical protein
MSLNIVFIIVGVLGFLGAAISLASLIVAARQSRPFTKWAAGMVVGLVLLVGGIGGDVLLVRQSKVPLNQTYVNSDYGISFRYPDGWKKLYDSMNPVFPTLPIDTLSSLYLPSDGESKNFPLNSFGGSLILSAPPGQNVIGVFKNTGNTTAPIWAALSVGREGVDAPGTKDCLWSVDNKTIVFASAPLQSARAVRVDYAVTGWSALVGFESPDKKCFFVVDVSRLGYGQSFSAWSQTWETSPKTNEGKQPDFEHFISSGAAQISGLTGLEKTYTDTQLGGRECKDFAVSANHWAYEVMTSTATPAKYSDWQSTIKAMLASINITAPVPTQ